VREGLNLLPFEYLLAREHFPGGPGAIVVSEFSASARVLSGGVPCNPWSIRKVGVLVHRSSVHTLKPNPNPNPNSSPQPQP